MRSQLVEFLRELGRSLRDLLPIIAVIAVFQVVVVAEPMPELQRRLLGAACALLGLTLFVRGLAMSIFPLGEGMADLLARRGSVTLLVAFGFALGFGSTAAEPALGAVADQASAAVAAATPTDRETGYWAPSSATLRYGSAAAVGVGIAFSVLRVVKGWPLMWFVLPGYGIATGLALYNPSPLSAIAFDAGAAATSAINIPLMLALGVGLAGMIRGRNPLTEGFGLVAMASLMPMLAILTVSAFIG